MKQSQESGFALLISLIVVGVVISVGLSVLDLTIKQVRLSTNAKESELAFHAANAGLECARYWRREQSDQMESGQNFTPECFGESSPVVGPSATNVPTILNVPNSGRTYLYTYQFTWGSVPDVRCTQINTVVSSSSPTGVGVTTTNMGALIPGYPGGNTKFCAPGAKCSTISVRGYNKACTSINQNGVVQREVLLQF